VIDMIFEVVFIYLFFFFIDELVFIRLHIGGVVVFISQC
jgi:hypothetical protein